MKPRLLEIIVCPDCGGDLLCAGGYRGPRDETPSPDAPSPRLDAVPRAGEAVEGQAGEAADEVMEGELTCEQGHFYPIISGIPRLLPPALLAETLQRHWPEHYARYRARLRSDGAQEVAVTRKTLRSFSYQWRVFSEMYSHWEENFRSYFAPLVEPRAFAGKLVLDAGCGFGRHAYYAARYGAEVVAMDLSEAVETAYANTRELPGVHVIQGNIYRPPVRPLFDLVYCVGVLQHLPDPGAGFASLARLLRQGAALFVWVYGQRRGIYRLVDLVRPLTTRLPMRLLYLLTGALNIASFLLFSAPYRALRRLPGAGRLAAAWPFTRYADLPLRVGHADWFDRLSVPSTVYFSQADVEAWFGDAGLQDVAIQSRDGIGWRALGRSPLGSDPGPAGKRGQVSVSELPKDGPK